MTATTAELPGMPAKPAPRGKYDDYHDAMFWLARFVRSRQYRFAKTLANNPVDMRHKTLVALFGGAAYMRERDISKLPRIMASGGRWALMTVPTKACRRCLGGVAEANYANNGKLFDAICSERIEASEFDWLYVS